MQSCEERGNPFARRLDDSNDQPLSKILKMGQGTRPRRARSLSRTPLPGVALSVCFLSPGFKASPQNPNLPEVQSHEGKVDDSKPFQIHAERNAD